MDAGASTVYGQGVQCLLFGRVSYLCSLPGRVCLGNVTKVEVPHDRKGGFSFYEVRNILSGEVLPKYENM